MRYILKLAPVLGVCFAVAVAAAFSVSVGVDTAMEGRVVVVDQPSPTAWTVELENPGSVTYEAQLRMVVRQGNETVFRTYAPAARLPPGSMHARTLAVTGTQVQGNATAQFVMRYGTHETTVDRRVTLPARNTSQEGAVLLPRLQEDAVRFLLATPTDVESVYVTVTGNPAWQFEQREVAATQRLVQVTAPFQPADYPGDQLTITVSSSAEGYHYTETVAIGRTDLIDRLRAWSALHLPFGHVFVT